MKRLSRMTLGGFTLRTWLMVSAGAGIVLTWAIGWKYGLLVAVIASLYSIAGVLIVERMSARRSRSRGVHVP